MLEAAYILYAVRDEYRLADMPREASNLGPARG